MALELRRFDENTFQQTLSKFNACILIGKYILQEINHPRLLPAVLPVSIALVCIALEIGGYSESLRFDRDLIESGALWLILTCNFVHLGMNHLLLNLAGLGLIYFLFWPNYNSLSWLLITLICSLGVGLGLYLWNPELIWYVGFSGTLHGLIIAGAIADLKRYPVSGGLLLALVAGKLIWEQVYGAMPGSEEIAGGHVVVDSHLYGAISGLLCAIFLSLAIRLQDLTAHSVDE